MAAASNTTRLAVARAPRACSAAYSGNGGGSASPQNCMKGQLSWIAHTTPRPSRWAASTPAYAVMVFARATSQPCRTEYSMT